MVLKLEISVHWCFLKLQGMTSQPALIILPTMVSILQMETTLLPMKSTLPPMETTFPPTEIGLPSTFLSPKETTLPLTETSLPPTETTFPTITQLPLIPTQVISNPQTVILLHPQFGIQNYSKFSIYIHPLLKFVIILAIMLLGNRLICTMKVSD